MQDFNWEDFDVGEFEEPQGKVKTKKQSKHKWREIESYKEKQREKKEMSLYEHSYSM